MGSEVVRATHFNIWKPLRASAKLGQKDFLLYVRMS